MIYNGDCKLCAHSVFTNPVRGTTTNEITIKSRHPFGDLPREKDSKIYGLWAKENILVGACKHL
jgi:hypothetical protein